jgi:preprotein translocase subunit SecE
MLKMLKDINRVFSEFSGSCRLIRWPRQQEIIVIVSLISLLSSMGGLFFYGIDQIMSYIIREILISYV